MTKYPFTEKQRAAADLLDRGWKGDRAGRFDRDGEPLTLSQWAVMF
jgi:hypothetical protein